MSIYPEEEVEQIIPIRKPFNPFKPLVWAGKALILVMFASFVLFMLAEIAMRLP